MMLYWIWLAELPNVQLSQKHILLQYFSDPEELYHAAAERCAAVPDIPVSVQNALENKDLTAARKILRDCERGHIRTVALYDSTYPTRLKSTREAPLVLYIKGSLPDTSETPSVGMVGTRKASPYGLTVSRRIGSQIAACGGIVVSGGAVGNDAAALSGAMEAGGSVIAVLACGLDNPGPKSNAPLFAKIQRQGCLLSEYPPGTPALRWHFPARNRIISGLSNGVLVAEAPKSSGSLITAKYACEQGRDLFAVPGNIDMSTYAGSNALLQDRATAVSCGWDIMKVYAPLYPDKVHKAEPKPLPEYTETPPQLLTENVKTPAISRPARAKKEELPIDKKAKPSYSVIGEPLPKLTPEEESVFSCIRTDPRPVDEVILETGIPANKVLTLLTMLSVKGLVTNHPGGQVSLK